MRKIADNADAFRVRAALQLTDQLQRIGRLEVQIENDELRPRFRLFQDLSGSLTNSSAIPARLAASVSLTEKKRSLTTARTRFGS